jgi:hypothetical protein
MRLATPLLSIVFVFGAAAADAQTLRDPTRPPQVQKYVAGRSGPTESTLVVTGVFSAGERQSAIVNGRLVHAGDTVAGCLIEAVLENGVRYRRAGAVHELHLSHAMASVKKPTTVSPAVLSGVK